MCQGAISVAKSMIRELVDRAAEIKELTLQQMAYELCIADAEPRPNSTRGGSKGEEGSLGPDRFALGCRAESGWRLSRTAAASRRPEARLDGRWSGCAQVLLSESSQSLASSVAPDVEVGRREQLT